MRASWTTRERGVILMAGKRMSGGRSVEDTLPQEFRQGLRDLRRERDENVILAALSILFLTTNGVLMGAGGLSPWLAILVLVLNLAFVAWAIHGLVEACKNYAISVVIARGSVLRVIIHEDGRTVVEPVEKKREEDSDGT